MYKSISYDKRRNTSLRKLSNLIKAGRVLEFEAQRYFAPLNTKVPAFAPLLCQELFCVLVSPVCKCLIYPNQSIKATKLLLLLFCCDNLNYDAPLIKSSIEQSLPVMMKAIEELPTSSTNVAHDIVNIVVERLQTFTFRSMTPNHRFLREMLYSIVKKTTTDIFSWSSSLLHNCLLLLADSTPICESIIQKKNHHILDSLESSSGSFEYGKLLIKFYRKDDAIIKVVCEKMAWVLRECFYEKIKEVFDFMRQLVNTVTIDSVQKNNGILWTIEILQNDGNICSKPELVLLSQVFIVEALKSSENSFFKQCLLQNGIVNILCGKLSRRKRQQKLRLSCREEIIHRCTSVKGYCWCRLYENNKITSSSEDSPCIAQIKYDNVVLTPFLDISDEIRSYCFKNDKMALAGLNQKFVWPFSHHRNAIAKASEYYQSKADNVDRAVDLKQKLLSFAQTGYSKAQEAELENESVIISTRDEEGDCDEDSTVYSLHFKEDMIPKCTSVPLQKGKYYRIKINSKITQLAGVVFSSGPKEAADLQEKFMWDKFSNEDVWCFIWKILVLLCQTMNITELVKYEDIICQTLRVEFLEGSIDDEQYQCNELTTMLRFRMLVLAASKFTQNIQIRDILRREIATKIKSQNTRNQMSLRDIETFPFQLDKITFLLKEPFNEECIQNDIEAFILACKDTDFLLQLFPLELMAPCFLKSVDSESKLQVLSKMIIENRDGDFSETLILTFIALYSYIGVDINENISNVKESILQALKLMTKKVFTDEKPSVSKIIVLSFLQNVLQRERSNVNVTRGIITDLCNLSSVIDVAIDYRTHCDEVGMTVCLLALEITERWIRYQLPYNVNKDFESLFHVVLNARDDQKGLFQYFSSICWVSGNMNCKKLLENQVWKQCLSFESGLKYPSRICSKMVHHPAVLEALCKDTVSELYWKICEHLAGDVSNDYDEIFALRIKACVNNEEQLRQAALQALLKISNCRAKCHGLINQIVTMIEDENIGVDLVILPLLILWSSAERNNSLYSLVKGNVSVIVRRICQAFSHPSFTEDSAEYWVRVLNSMFLFLLQEQTHDIQSLVEIVKIRECVKGSTLDSINLQKGQLKNSNILCTIPEILKQFRSITVLDLSLNKLQNQGAITIASWLADSSCRLESLNLSNNEIAPPGLTTLADSLRCNKVLQSLDISENLLTEMEDESGIIALAESIIWNTSLRRLDISYNRLTQNGLLSMTRALRYNGSLIHLNLDMTCASQVQLYAVEEKLNLNRLGITKSPHVVLRRYVKTHDESVNERAETVVEQCHLDKEKARTTFRVLCGGYQSTFDKLPNFNENPKSRSALERLIEDRESKTEPQGTCFVDKKHDQEPTDDEHPETESPGQRTLEEEIVLLKAEISALREREQVTLKPNLHSHFQQQ